MEKQACAYGLWRIFFFAPVNIFKLVMDQLTMYNVKGVVHNLMNQQRMHPLSGSPQCYGAS